MSASTTPQHEPETLAAQTSKAAAAAVQNPGHLTPEQVVDAMLPAAIEAAAKHAEATFLALTAGPMSSGQVEWVTLSAIADMQLDANKIADEIGANAEQRHRLITGRAALFDLRLAELQAHTVFGGGRA